MRGMVEELLGCLRWFTQDQVDDFAMLVACEDGDTPIVLSLLEGLSDADPARMFLSFAHEARTPRAYVDVMIELLRTRLPVLDAMRAERGAGPFPSPPAALLDGQKPAAQRLRELLLWWRSGLQDPEDRIVLVLLPTKIPSVEVYREIAWPLLATRGVEPWMRHVRVIVRDGRKAPFLEPLCLEHRVDGVVGFTADFSPEACEQGLASDAGNADLDERSRALALLQLAAMDFAQRRHVQALEKYGHLANVFHGLEDKASVALCLVGAGDVLRQVERHEDARERYGQAIQMATEVQSKPIVLNGMIGLAESAMAVREYVAAEKAWDGAARVAGAMGMEMPVADLVEQVGVARAKQGRAKDAWVVWEKALEYLEEPERAGPYPQREVSILERMVKLAQEQHWSGLAEEKRKQLAVAQHRLSVLEAAS